MRSTFFSISFLALPLSALANPHLSPFVLHEKRSHVPHGWSHSHKHHADAVLPLRFGLTQANIENIDEYINDIAHPDSPNYGKHWTPAQVIEKFAPKDDTVQAVKSWLVENGLDEGRIRMPSTKIWIGMLLAPFLY